VVQSEARRAGGISSGVSADALLFGVGSRYDECARSRHQVFLVRKLYRHEGMGKRALDAACAHVCRAGNRAGEAYATGSPGQARAFTWSSAVDNYTVAVE
jgi:hypothetical protein